MKKDLHIICALLFSLLFQLTQAQTTRLKGTVTDAASGEAIPFANIFLEGTSYGVTSDLDGQYTLEARAPEARVVTAVILGYEAQSFMIVPGSYSEVHFRLTQSDNLLAASVIKPDDSYVRSLLRKADERKTTNNPELRSRYNCELYSKLELDINDAERHIRNRSFRKNFGFVFDYMDTSVVSGQAFLPVMISESRARRYHSLDPGYDKEIIEASRISGLNEENIFSQFTGSLHMKTNFYERFIQAFNVDIPSPLSPNGTLYYNYYLVDSLSIDGRKSYKIRFHPKKGITSPAFDGELSLDAEEYALHDLHAKLPRGMNVNWIRDLVIDIENQRGDSLWFYKDEKLYVDFAPTQKDSSLLMTFIGRREIHYSRPDYAAHNTEEIHLSSENVVVRRDAMDKGESYWDEARPYALSEREQGIYRMVEQVKDVPLYHNIYTLAETLFNGYYKVSKYVGIGPYSQLISFNDIEGVRPQLGLRTNSDLSKYFRLTAYLAYGLKDRDFKGMGQGEFVFNNQPMRKLTVSARKDLVQLGRSQNSLSENNIFSSFLTKEGGYNKRSPVNEFILSYEHEFRPGFTNSFGIEFQRIFANDVVPLNRPDGTSVTSVGANKLHYSARFSWDETITRGPYEKYYLYTTYPVISLDLTGSLKGIGHYDYTFFRTDLTVDWYFRTAPLGHADIRFNTGHIFGNVPYPMLKLHEGNNTYFLDRSAFACMDFYEFASDTWATLHYEHNFGGFFFGRIPLIQKLQLREIASLNLAYGTIAEHNNGIIGNDKMRQATLLFPEGMGQLNKPYVEMGVGIGNILRLLRVDCFWRMTHRDVAHRFAVNFGIQWSF